MFIWFFCFLFPCSSKEQSLLDLLSRANCITPKVGRPFAVGDAIVVEGLVSAVALNGVKGKVTALPNDKGQVAVNLASVQKEDIVFNPKNLLRVENAATGIERENVYHQFISYRQSTDKEFALKLYSQVRARSLDFPFGGSEGDKPRPFLDLKCLQDGEPWQQGFIQGLSCTLVLVPLVTWVQGDFGSIGQMASLDPANGKDWVDNVLLEYELALAMLEAEDSLLSAIFPVMR